MKNYEGKSTSFALCYGGKVKRIFDRKIFADRKLYPGISWKYAHFILFGYYPKDWDDMLTFTSNDDPRFFDNDESLSLKYLEDDDFEFDDYDYVYEAIKFIMEEEPKYIDESIHKNCVGKKYYNKHAYGRTSDLVAAFSTLEIKIDLLDKDCLLVYMEEKYGNLKSTYCCYCEYIKSIFIHFMYMKSKSQKNPVEEAAKEKANDKAKEALKEGKFTKYLNIKSKLYSDEVIKKITESFNKAVIPTFKDASKQSKEFFKVVEKAVKSGNFRLANLKETKNGFSFVLKNKDIRFDFDDKGNVNYKITPVSFEGQAAK